MTPDTVRFLVVTAVRERQAAEIVVEARLARPLACPARTMRTHACAGRTGRRVGDVRIRRVGVWLIAVGRGRKRVSRVQHKIMDPSANGVTS